MTCTPEEAILLEEQEIKIANLICENHRLRGLLDDAGIAYVYDVRGEEHNVARKMSGNDQGQAEK